MFEARHSVVVLPFTRPPRQEPLRGLLRILRVRLVVVLAVIAGLKPAVGCSDLAAQTLQSVVVGSVVGPDGRPIVGAEVGIVDVSVLGRADGLGRFKFVSDRSGRVSIFARAVGYRPVVRQVDLVLGDTIEVHLSLTPVAVVLPELSTEALWGKPARLAHTSKFDDFYRRRRMGFGTFFDRDDIERSTALRSFELLRGVSGVQVAWNPPGVPGTTVRFARCTEFPPRIGVWLDGNKLPFRPPNPPPGASGATTPEEGARSTNIDKMLTWKQQTWSMWLELFDFVRPSEIEAMEVYRGVGQIPAEFRDDSCAAVVIWTRQGGR